MLSPNQIERIRERLESLNLMNGPLKDEFLDHVSCAIEARMAKGQSFENAINQILHEIKPSKLRKYQTLTSKYNRFKPFDMLHNHIHTSIRNFRRNKVYSILNILGLALGITCAAALFNYIRFETSYDQFQDNAEDIYRVRVDTFREGNPPLSFAVAYIPTGPYMKAEISQVADFVTLNKLSARGIISYYTPSGSKIKFQQDDIFYSSSDFFKVFSFKLLKGNPETALTEPNQIVVTESEAKKYFGSDDPMGKSLVRNGRQTFNVTGIIEDPPVNSHIKFKMLMSLETILTGRDFLRDNWGWWDFYTYVKVAPGTKLAELQEEVDKFVLRHVSELDEKNNSKTQYIMQPLTSIHLNSHVGYEHEVNGNAQTIYFLSIITIFILVLAWVNYVNLATSRSMERAKEVGLRKTLGSYRGSIIQQFLTEAFLLNLMALLIGIGFAWMINPVFSQFLGFMIPVSFDLNFVLLLFAVLVVGTLLSGFYPAIIVSRFSPVQALMKSRISSTSGFPLRKVLVIFQMAVSISLIAFTLGVNRQVRYMTNHELGMNIDQMLVVNGAGIRDSTFSDRLSSFKSTLKSHHSVLDIVTSSDVPGKEIEWSMGFNIDGDADAFSVLRILGVDYEFLNTYHMEMVAGRKFGNEAPWDTVCIINMAAVESFGFTNPEDVIGKKLLNNNRRYRIVGVSADFRYRGLGHVAEPVIFWDDDFWSSYYTIKFNSGENPVQTTSELISLASEEWDKNFSENPFDYFLLDDFFNNQYRAEVQFGKVFGLFSILAIIIACLGLFGLTSYTVSKRTKEISIRKVLGASVSGILLLLSRNFMLLLLGAFLIAIPASYLGINGWLNGFPSRIEMDVTLFLVPGLIVFLLTILIISFQTITTARSNPVDAIRNE